MFALLTKSDEFGKFRETAVFGGKFWVGVGVGFAEEKF